MEHTCITVQEYYKKIVWNMHKVLIEEYGCEYNRICPSIEYLIAYMFKLKNIPIDANKLQTTKIDIDKSILEETDDMSYISKKWYILSSNILLKSTTALIYMLNATGRLDRIMETLE